MSRSITRHRSTRVGVGTLAATLAFGLMPQASRAAESLDQIKAEIAQATAPVKNWDGPTTGLKAGKGKFVVYVADTQTNAGSAGSAAGAKEAAAVLGWRFQLIDGQNTAAGEANAFEQAIALKPDGIIIGSLAATQFKTLFKRASDQGIKTVSWHSAASPGPIEDVPEVFWNLSTDPYAIANTAAKYAVVHSDGKANAVILTDPQFAIVNTKTKGEKEGIEACQGCSVLSIENAPYTQISQRMPSLMSALLQRYPNKLGYVLAFNDLYFDFSVPTLRANGVAADGIPHLISAGDGSVSAYDRIRKGDYQIGTVPEPLNVQGWQAMDELNRAFVGNRPEGYQSSRFVFATYQNAGLRVFDIANPFRPEEVGWFVPPLPRRMLDTRPGIIPQLHTADVYVEKSGLAFITDFNAGLCIVQNEWT